MSHDAILEAACALAARARTHTDEIEAAGRLPAALVEELARAGLFRMLVPRALGGGEVPPEVMIRALETLARADGVVGWCVMIGATSGLLSAYLDEDVARQVYGDPAAIMSGVLVPMGKAVDAGEHYRVSGRWSFASGVEVAGYRVGGVVMMNEAGTLLSDTGAPVIRYVVLRAEQTRIAGVRSGGGARGTRGPDMIAEEAVVPKRLSVSFPGDRPRHEGPLYRLPILGVLSLGIAAVALGVAREAIGTLTALARETSPVGSTQSLAHRERVQAHVAEAEGLVRSARAFLFEATAEATESAASRGEVREQDRALLRLAATQATRTSVRAVSLVYQAGGGSSIHTASSLQRHLRDVNLAAQHAVVAEGTYAIIGRALLGLGGDERLL